MSLSINSLNNNNLNNNKTLGNISFNGATYSQQYYALLQKAMNSKKHNVFEKSADVATDGIARALGGVVSLPGTQKFINWIHKSEHGMAHLLAGVNTILTLSTINGVRKSEKIEQDQKLPLMLNEILTGVTTISGGYLIDAKLKKVYDKFINTFMHVNKGLVQGHEEMWRSGLSKARTLVVITFIYRYLGPVAVTPVANKLSNWIVGTSRHNKQKQQAEKEKEVAKA